MKELRIKLGLGLKKVGFFMQRIVVAFFLILIYLLGFGLTKIALAVFKNKRLNSYKFCKNESYWLEAEGYEPDANKALRQF